MNKQLDDRIQHIINNLRPTSSFTGKFNQPQTLENRLKYYNTPGVSIATIDNFEIEWADGFGLCDSRFKNKVTTETLFQAGSISKPIFALGVMRLVQEGQLNLDEDIHHYLSSWQLPANEGWQPRITLRQLLSHTAGLTVHGFPGYQSSESLPTLIQVLNGEFPANTDKVEVNILPGTQYRYSGGGTTIAQQILVDLLKKPFPQIMHDLIFEPLGLTNSTYQQPLPHQLANRAATAHPSKGIPLQGEFHTYPEMAAAGLWTTASDLAKIGIELLKVIHDLKSSNLLTKEIIETMLQPQLDCQKIGEDDFVGLGFFCSGKEDNFWFGHGGWNEGFVAKMRLYKNTGKGVVVMLNSNEGVPLLDEIIQSVAREYEYLNALPKEKIIIALANKKDYAGIYLTETGIQFHINIVDDILTLQYGQQPPLSIFPSSEVEFFTKAINADICFEKDANADIISLTLSQEGEKIKANKQVEK